MIVTMTDHKPSSTTVRSAAILTPGASIQLMTCSHIPTRTTAEWLNWHPSYNFPQDSNHGTDTLLKEFHQCTAIYCSYPLELTIVQCINVHTFITHQPFPLSHSATILPTLMLSPGWVRTTWTPSLPTRLSTTLKGLLSYSKILYTPLAVYSTVRKNQLRAPL